MNLRGFFTSFVFAQKFLAIEHSYQRAITEFWEDKSFELVSTIVDVAIFKVYLTDSGLLCVELLEVIHFFFFFCYLVQFSSSVTSPTLFFC